MEIKTILFWLLLLAFVIPCYYFAFTKVIAQRQVSENFRRWNYSMLFMRLLGLLEMGATTLLLFPATRFFGAGIYACILAGAVFTHVRARDPKKEIMTPVFVGIHLVVLTAFFFFL